jgi:hypothetical protein
MLRITGASVAAVIAFLPTFATPAHASLAATGVIEGRITDQAGATADATVTVHAVDDSFSTSVYTWDFEDGRYRVEGLEPGSYQVSIYDNRHGTQWVPGKETRDEAAVYEVAEGAMVTVDDQWLPFGAVRVKVSDADTGKPVPRPCVSIRSTPQDRQACGTKGVVVVPDVQPGDWDISVGGGASYFADPAERQVSVRRGKTTRLSTTLRPGAAVVTKVVDRATGAPLDAICVHLVDPVWSGQSAHMGLTCSDNTGRLEIGPFEEAWTANLYALQFRNTWDPPTALYGDQWVAQAGGGTGDQRAALKVKFVPKRTRTIPAITMDPPATITGVVRDAVTGAPVGGVCAYPYAFHPGQGHNVGKHCSNAEGRYTIDDIGPYNWPVEFAPGGLTGYAWQWSGDVPHRYAATYTQLEVGASATVDANLVKGAELAGTVTTDGQPVDWAYVEGYNRTTRDPAGPSRAYAEQDGTFSLGVYRTQNLWVSFFADGKDCWYGSTPEAATALGVTAGATTNLTLDIAANCASVPGGLSRSSEAAAGFRGLVSGS